MPWLTWLVTGCTSGIGSHFVPAILARGDQVTATARNRTQRLQQAKEAGAATLDLDITAPQAELDAKVKEAIGIYGSLDVLMDNAGYIEASRVEEASYDRLIAQFNTNLFGMVECLQRETTPFGIQSVIFEPGYYRTKIFSPVNVKTAPSRIDDYEEMAKGIAGFVAATNGNQPGDPMKLVERIIDVLKLEGMAAGKSIPQRLPIERDALATVRRKCEDTLKLYEEWESLIVSTDIDGGE